MASRKNTIFSPRHDLGDLSARKKNARARSNLSGGHKGPCFFRGKNILHLPTAKCHIYTTITGAMKNAFGGLLATRRFTPIAPSTRPSSICWRSSRRSTRDLHVMDATFCGNGPGPRTMVPVEKGLMLASADSVAIDAVAAKIMGFDPMKIGFIRLAHEDGLGIGRIEEIEVLGEEIPMNFHFSVGNNLASRVGKLIWFGLAKKLQRLFFHTPWYISSCRLLTSTMMGLVAFRRETHESSGHYGVGKVLYELSLSLTKMRSVDDERNTSFRKRPSGCGTADIPPLVVDLDGTLVNTDLWWNLFWP